MQQLGTKGTGSSDNLKIENEGLKAQVAALSGEAQSLLDEIKHLTKKLLNAHTIESDRTNMLLNSLTLIHFSA